MSVAALERARRMALAFLDSSAHPTEKDIDRAVQAAVAGVAVDGHAVEADKLRRRLEADVSVFIGQGAVLEDHDANHRPWLDTRRAEISWRFWDAYREWSRPKLPPDVLRGLDRLTDDILGRLEDPRREGRWDRRGMVVGEVQSGKTANYTGLICKAADAGYPFIVVLAGLHNSLRSQTQRRLDEAFLGLDSRTSLAFQNTNRAIGVGAGGRRHPAAYTLTSSDERGDFAKAVAGRVAGRIGSDPVLLVVKKHRTILNNLIEWVTQANGQLDPDTGEMVVSRFPLLLIDDEADNASVNTNAIEYEVAEDGTILDETNPTEINRLIRRLLRSFDRSAFVSYTATPFANIFIDEERGPSAVHGEDLFPRSFILRMPPPSNYVGPATVFGLDAAGEADREEGVGLPVLRTVNDHEEWLRTGHRKEATPGALPTSLREAVRSFILVCAARAARGQIDVHNSMLVHVTRFIAVQGLVREQIDQELEELRDRLMARGGRRDAEAMRDEFKALWERDFEPTFQRMPRRLRGAAVPWEAVEGRLAAAVGRIGPVLEINGTARDALTYADHPDGLSVIAVGGDKLSRGLTLEGLSVSYYLRASKMYDTLMQMGRWFGYRDGYADLLRLYTTDELQDWYRDITIANEELSTKFDEMARVGSNPREFALYVRKSPAGLLVTAQAKMRSGREMDLSFSDDVIETITFERKAELQRQNLEHVDRFLLGRKRSAQRAGDPRHPRWDGVSGEDVASFLEMFRTFEGASKARGRLLAEYVRSQLSAGELREWTVILIHNSQAKDWHVLAGERVGLTQRSHFRGRSPGSPQGPGDGEYRIRRLGDPMHEALDLSVAERALADRKREAAYEVALQEAEAAGVERSAVRRPAIGPFARKERPVERGLLCLYLLDPSPAEMDDSPPAIPGFLVSFPMSSTASAIKYVVPRRFWDQVAS